MKAIWHHEKAWKLPSPLITQRDVVNQTACLHTYPVVEAALQKGTLRIAGCVYDIEHRKVLEYDPVADKLDTLRA